MITCDIKLEPICALFLFGSVWKFTPGARTKLIDITYIPSNLRIRERTVICVSERFIVPTNDQIDHSLHYITLLVASPMSLWLLWWPPTGSSMFMVFVMLHIYSVLHCLYSVGNKITTTTTITLSYLNQYWNMSQHMHCIRSKHKSQHLII